MNTILLFLLYVANRFQITFKHLDSILPQVCSVIDHSRSQIVVRTSLTYIVVPPCYFLVLTTSHFAVI